MKKIYDLTHVVDENTYHPLGAASFKNIQMFGSHRCRHAFVTMSLHFGTHMDAPWHMVEKGRRLDEIPAGDLVREAVVIDISRFYSPDVLELGEISASHLEEATAAPGLDLKAGDALVIYTGWAGIFNTDPIRYYSSYSTLGQDACEWISLRRIAIVALDVPDVDLPEKYSSPPFNPVNHRKLLGEGIYVVENVGGEIGSVLNRRVTLISAPINLGGEYASGAPVRLLAM